MVKIMIDKSPKQIAEYSARYNYEFWQLRTPLTRFALAGVPYGLDNGCFTEFDYKTWKKLLADAISSQSVFVCMPDIVGDARRTREMFDYFYEDARPLPKAFVLQDGIENVDIPWRHIKAVFVGGSDAFKHSPTAFNACKAAKMCGKWIHVGRVNTVERMRAWMDYADSIDGTGLIHDPLKMARVLDVIRGEHPQKEIFTA